jgi:hypothetical protein
MRFGITSLKHAKHLRVILVGSILNFEMISWRMPVGIHGKPKGEQDQTLQQSQDWFLITLVATKWIFWPANAEETTY